VSRPFPLSWVHDPGDRDVIIDDDLVRFSDTLVADAVAEVPAFLKLALYAADRGEGDAEAAREILQRLGFCAVCRHDRTDETDCSCEWRVGYFRGPEWKIG
jgi:hypothetical protein